MKRISMVVVAVAIAAFIGYVSYGVNHIVSQDLKMQHKDVLLEKKSADIKALELEYKTLNSNLDKELQKNQTDEATVKELQRQKDEVDKRNKELEQQIQARAAEKQRIALAASKAINTVTGTATASAASSTDADKAFIYAHESGNNPGSINVSSGACGLGQALPCSKMPCTLSDYACQDAFFTQYAMARYGSWSAARAFWESHRWW